MFTFVLMLDQTASHVEKVIRQQERKLFFRRWLKHPLQMGTLAPITVRLAESAALLVDNPKGMFVEIGAGTGRLTRSLLRRIENPANLAAVELDSVCWGFLQETLPTFLPSDQKLPHIIHGDAVQLPHLLPEPFVGNVDTVFSVIPLMYLHESTRQAIIDAAFRVLKPGGSILHITYNPKSPLNFMKHIRQSRQTQLWWNLPPGFVWHYQKIPSV